jgi:hypothetical protein
VGAISVLPPAVTRNLQPLTLAFEYSSALFVTEKNLKK